MRNPGNRDYLPGNSQGFLMYYKLTNRYNNRQLGSIK